MTFLQTCGHLRTGAVPESLRTIIMRIVTTTAMTMLLAACGGGGSEQTAVSGSPAEPPPTVASPAPAPDPIDATEPVPAAPAPVLDTRTHEFVCTDGEARFPIEVTAITGGARIWESLTVEWDSGTLVDDPQGSAAAGLWRGYSVHEERDQWGDRRISIDIDGGGFTASTVYTFRGTQIVMVLRPSTPEFSGIVCMRSTMDFPQGSRRLAREEGHDAEALVVWTGLSYGQASTVRVTLNGAPVEGWVWANEATGEVVYRDSLGQTQTGRGEVRILIAGWWE